MSYSGGPQCDHEPSPATSAQRSPSSPLESNAESVQTGELITTDPQQGQQEIHTEQQQQGRPIVANLRPTSTIHKPRRGRRLKRPELTEYERKRLRALQSREATRRSRAKNRMEKESLKQQLELVTSERDQLLQYIHHHQQQGQHRESASSLPLISDRSVNIENARHFPPSSTTICTHQPLPSTVTRSASIRLSSSKNYPSDAKTSPSPAQTLPLNDPALTPALDKLQPIEPPCSAGLGASFRRRRPLHPIGENDSLLRYLPKR